MCQSGIAAPTSAEGPCGFSDDHSGRNPICHEIFRNERDEGTLAIGPGPDHADPGTDAVAKLERECPQRVAAVAVLLRDEKTVIAVTLDTLEEISGGFGSRLVLELRNSLLLITKPECQ